METKEGLIAQVALLQLAVMKERFENERLRNIGLSIADSAGDEIATLLTDLAAKDKEIARLRHIVDRMTDGGAE
jgi:hypothetical protein